MKAGVYTAAQADRGQALFRSKCASCHAPNRFTDDLFYTSFAGKPLWEMFDVISDSMPEDNPGSMKKEEYADVIAYLLKLNNFPDRRDRPADRQGRAQRDPDGKALARPQVSAGRTVDRAKRDRDRGAARAEHHHADRAPFRVPARAPAPIAAIANFASNATATIT